jgi:hypothetical protein
MWILGAVINAAVFVGYGCVHVDVCNAKASEAMICMLGGSVAVTEVDARTAQWRWRCWRIGVSTRLPIPDDDS